MRIGVMLPNWVGDLAMVTPTLRALRRHFAQAEIVGILRPYLLPVLEGTHWLDRTIEWEHIRRGGWQNRWQAIGKLRAARFDKIVLLRNSFHAALMARIAGAKEIIGYTRDHRSWLLTGRIKPPYDGRQLRPESVVDASLRIAYSLGCPPESPLLELATTPAEEALAAAAWQRLNLPEPQRVVVLNTGGAFGTAKHWPLEHCIGLSRRIAIELGRAVLVNCGPQERAVAAEIERAADHPLVRSLAHEGTCPLA